MHKILLNRKPCWGKIFQSEVGIEKLNEHLKSEGEGEIH